jgi:polyisoprenoid-binding protein YceI
MKKYLLIFAFILLAPTAKAESARYYIPPTQFNAALEVMDLGFSNVFGLFRNATGGFEFDEGAKSIRNLKLALDATSMTANNPGNERDLMVLFAASQFPEISFVAKDSATFTDGKASIKGTLTVRGFSKPCTLEAVLNHMGKSPQGGGMWSNEGDALGLSLHGSFKRADFGMTDDPNMPSRFGEMITLRLETQAIKQ